MIFMLKVMSIIDSSILLIDPWNFELGDKMTRWNSKLDPSLKVYCTLANDKSLCVSSPKFKVSDPQK